MEEKTEYTKEEWKVIKKEKKKRRREQEIRKVIKKSQKNPDTVLYQFQKFLSTNPKIALKEYQALGYNPTKAQIKYMEEQERKRKEKVKQKRQRKEQETMNRAYEEYADAVIQRFLETGEIVTLQDYQIIKDELF